MVSRETSISRGLEGLGLTAELDMDVVASKLAQLTEYLETRAIPLGFLGPSEAERIVPRHILESAAMVRFLPDAGAVVDIGSGAGLPGLVMACLRPGDVTLIEAQARRSAFLREAIRDLELDAEVVRGRAEDLARGQLRESASGVTARALAALPVALELTVPFAERGGTVVVAIGAGEATGRFEHAAERTPARADADLDEEPGQLDGERWAQVCTELGGGVPATRGFEVPGVGERRWAMIVQKIRNTPARYPRSAGAIKRRPLG